MRYTGKISFRFEIKNKKIKNERRTIPFLNNSRISIDK